MTPLKNMKFKIDSPEQSAALQKVLFEMGYDWQLSTYKGTIQSTEKGFLYANVIKRHIYTVVASWDCYEDTDTAAFIEAHNERKECIETPVAIDAHYNFNYTLSQEDIDMGYIKVDPYFVSNAWKLGSKDETGVIFHIMKNISRFGDKNTKEREIVAIYKSVKRLAQLEGVDLDGV